MPRGLAKPLEHQKKEIQRTGFSSSLLRRETLQLLTLRAVTGYTDGDEKLKSAVDSREPVKAVAAAGKGQAFSANPLGHCKPRMSHGKEDDS